MCHESHSLQWYGRVPFSLLHMATACDRVSIILSVAWQYWPWKSVLMAWEGYT